MTSYLMIKCHFAAQVWSMVKTWIKCSLSSYELHNNLQVFKMESKERRKEEREFNLIRQCIMWRIWKKGNDFIFNSVDPI